jgi:hypothetical protein
VFTSQLFSKPAISDKDLNSISIRQELRKDLGDLGGLGGENLRALTLEGPFGVVAEGAADCR